jgi:glutathione S-transferase
MSSEANAKPALTYWPIGGLGTACRLALIHAVGIDGFVDRHVERYEEYEQRCEKVPFLNLPYLEFPGGRVISQSNAVLKAIGRRYHLNGETLDEHDLVDELLHTWMDFQAEYDKMTYECDKTQFEEYRRSFLAKTMVYYYGRLDTLLAARETPYLAGNKVTVVDFKAWSSIDAVARLQDGASRIKSVEAHHHVVEWLRRVEELPSVRAYLASSASALPPNGTTAHWGSTASPKSC